MSITTATVATAEQPATPGTLADSLAGLIEQRTADGMPEYRAIVTGTAPADPARLLALVAGMGISLADVRSDVEAWEKLQQIKSHTPTQADLDELRAAADREDIAAQAARTAREKAEDADVAASDRARVAFNGAQNASRQRDELMRAEHATKTNHPRLFADPA